MHRDWRVLLALEVHKNYSGNYREILQRHTIQFNTHPLDISFFRDLLHRFPRQDHHVLFWCFAELSGKEATFIQSKSRIFRPHIRCSCNICEGTAYRNVRLCTSIITMDCHERALRSKHWVCSLIISQRDHHNNGWSYRPSWSEVSYWAVNR